MFLCCRRHLWLLMNLAMTWNMSKCCNVSSTSSRKTWPPRSIESRRWTNWPTNLSWTDIQREMLSWSARRWVSVEFLCKGASTCGIRRTPNKFSYTNSSFTECWALNNNAILTEHLFVARTTNICKHGCWRCYLILAYCLFQLVPTIICINFSRWILLFPDKTGLTIVRFIKMEKSKFYI